MPNVHDFTSEGANSIKFDGDPIKSAWDRACGIDAGYKALQNAIGNDSALDGVNRQLADENSAKIHKDLQECKDNGPPPGATVKSIQEGVAPQNRAIQGYSNITVF